MTEWAATTDQVIDNGYGGSRNGSPINGGIIHHGAGLDVLAYVAGYNDRSSHPTYHIDRWGKVTGVVHPNRRPYSTANSVDLQAITFELDNWALGGDWPISDATMEAMIEVLLDHERQSERTGFARNIPGVTQAEFFIGYHSQYVNTGCPGPYVTARIDWLVGELNRRRNGAAPKPKDDDMKVFAHLPTDAWAVGGPGIWFPIPVGMGGAYEVAYGPRIACSDPVWIAHRNACLSGKPAAPVPADPAVIRQAILDGLADVKLDTSLGDDDVTRIVNAFAQRLAA